MGQLAVGIVLIPEPHILKELIQLNQRLFDRTIELGLDRNFPHITLSMIHMDRTHLPMLISELNNMDQHIRLTTTGIRKVSSGSGKDLLWLDIELTDELNELHEEAMRLREKFHIPRTTAEAFWQQHAGNNSIQYVEHFEQHGYKAYKPHVTIGYGNEELDSTGFDFDARIALGELGNGCVVVKEAG